MSKVPWPAIIAFGVISLGGAAVDLHGQAASTLRAVKAVRCSFSAVATGDWDDNGVGKAGVTKSALTVSYDSIDTEDGTARLNDRYGDSPIIAKLSFSGLHLLQMSSEGALRVTTVFDTASQPGRYKAVYTVHEYTAVRLPGFTSRPEQHYGECEAGR